MKGSTKWLILSIAILITAVVGISILALNLNTSVTEISYTEFQTKAKNGEITEVTLSGYIATASTSDAKVSYELVIDSRQGFADLINTINDELENGTEIKTPIKLVFDDPNANAWVNFIWPVISLIIMGVLIFFIFKQIGGGGSKSGISKNKAKANENIKVRFTDVAGAEEEKEELKEIVEFLKTPKKFSDLGARIPKGVLLVGPPGTGKTLFAKAVAGEAGVPFFSKSGSDFVEMFVGVGASRVRDMFEMAKKNQPCIVFIDEIDAVGRARSGTGGGGDGHNEREQTLNQLLVQMDGFDDNTGIIIMAATNRADVLDSALLRPGRFDRQIYVNAPDVRGREAIFKVHTRNKPMSPEINYKTLARITSGFTGADIENLLNEAAILAARENRKYVTMKDVNEGINKVIMGPQKKSRIVTETDKRITAYHEAGHAIIARVLPNCDPVHEVSIIPRGMAAGYTMTRPDNDDSFLSKNKLIDNMSMILGGRVAEEIIIKDVSTGASSDIQKVSSIARSMVTEWGMTDLGPILYVADQNNPLGIGTKPYSEDLATKIDERVSNFVNGAHDKTTKILTENISILHGMARLLVERETIYSDEIDMLFEGKTVDEIVDYIENKIAKEDLETKNNQEPTVNKDKKTITNIENPIVENNYAEEKAKNDDTEGNNENKTD